MKSKETFYAAYFALLFAFALALLGWNPFHSIAANALIAVVCLALGAIVVQTVKVFADRK